MSIEIPFLVDDHETPCSVMYAIQLVDAPILNWERFDAKMLLSINTVLSVRACLRAYVFVLL